MGGGLGSLLRYWISNSLNPVSNNFFWGTFTVNILGCLFLGLLTGYSIKHSSFPAQLSLLFATGFCGGFTTFSTFILEDNYLLRDGHWFSFIAYVGGSLLAGYTFLWFGIQLTSRF